MSVLPWGIAPNSCLLLSRRAAPTSTTLPATVMPAEVHFPAGIARSRVKVRHTGKPQGHAERSNRRTAALCLGSGDCSLL